MYTYIQSRFYRAPEIILGEAINFNFLGIPYTTSIDIWSFGCMMFELYMGYPLFPSESEGDLLSIMMELKGIPPTYLIEVFEKLLRLF
jgi:dual specificity tyrosine-phosphorylation-regulated kinase 2/3/4